MLEVTVTGLGYQMTRRFERRQQADPDTRKEWIQMLDGQQDIRALSSGRIRALVPARLADAGAKSRVDSDEKHVWYGNLCGGEGEGDTKWAGGLLYTNAHRTKSFTPRRTNTTVMQLNEHNNPSQRSHNRITNTAE